MKTTGYLRSSGSLALRAICAFGIGALAAATVAAEENSAEKILKNMTEYVKEQPSMAVTYDSTIEVVTPSIEKIQFNASGNFTLVRPNKFRLNRTGGYADVTMVSDGTTVTIHDKDGQRFAQVRARASFEEVVDELRTSFMVEIPGADLVLPNAYEVLMADVLESKHVGRGVVNGVECEHLAFRNAETDWQIWIEVGERPIPRKYVITSKVIAAAPQYTLLIREWHPAKDVAAGTFGFTPPTGSRGVEITALSDIDEVPHGVVPGGRK